MDVIQSRYVESARPKGAASTRSSPIELVNKQRGDLIRKINDAHIFTGQAIMGLEEVRARYAKSRDETKKYYEAPSLSKKGLAKRTDEQLTAQTG